MDGLKIRVSHKTIFYYAFAMYVFVGILGNSMLGQFEKYEIIKRCTDLFCLLLIGIRILIKKKWGKSQLLLWIIAIIICFVIYINMGAALPVMLMVMMLGAYGCSSITIAKIHMAIVGTMTLLSMILANIGVIEDRLFYDSTKGGVVRHSMGFTYVTIWAGVMFFLVLDYLYINEKSKGKIGFVGLLITASVGLYINMMSHTRVEVLAIILVIVALIIYKKVFGWKFSKIVIIFIMPISAVLTYILEYMYIFNPFQYRGLNTFFSNRLALAAQGILTYGITLFGTAFKMQGYGSVNFDDAFGYFFIDSFYINYLLQYGVIFLLLIILLCTFVNYKLYCRENYLLLLFVSMAAIHGIIISSVMVPAICPWLVIAFAEMGNKREMLKIENKI